MPELEAIWNVGKAMRRKNYPEMHSSLKYSWSSDISPIMQMVEGSHVYTLEFLNFVGEDVPT